MEQELAAGLGEGQIAQFIEDQKVETGDQVGGSALAFSADFGVQLVHQIDDVEEPSAPAIPDAGASNTDGEMGFAGSGVADQDQVALMIQGVPGGQITDQGLVDLGRREGDQRNHHAHVLTTTRQLEPQGLTTKTRVLDSAKTGGVEIEQMRGVWAELQNRALERVGEVERVDHRLLEKQRELAQDRGDELKAEELDRDPELKLGPAANSMERREKAAAERDSPGREQERLHAALDRDRSEGASGGSQNGEKRSIRDRLDDVLNKPREHLEIEDEREAEKDQEVEKDSDLDRGPTHGL